MLNSRICKALFLGLSIVLLANYGQSRLLGSHQPLIIKPIVGRFDHGEGPHWDHHTNSLYFVDIDLQKICKFTPVIQDLHCLRIANGPVGFVIPVDRQPFKYIVGAGTDFLLVTWNSRKNVTRVTPQTLTVVDKDRKGTRWNDGKADAAGRFWGGTIGPEVNDVVVPNQASFYRIASDYIPVKEISPVTNSNGLAWNKEGNKLYYIDTPTRVVAVYDFDSIKGTISNKKIAFDLDKHKVRGLPDGMTIDEQGNLWIALYNDGSVVNVNPNTGEIIRFVKLPVSKVTSVTFGGPRLSTLYVTTSSRGLTPEELKKEPYAGYVFSVEGLNVRGLVANNFRTLESFQ